MFKKLPLPIFAAIIATALAFTTNSGIENNEPVDKAWFEYIGLSYSSSELEKQTNYQMLDYEPPCKDGSARCAIFAEIVDVGGVEYPAVDQSNKVVFSDELRFNP